MEKKSSILDKIANEYFESKAKHVTINIVIDESCVYNSYKADYFDNFVDIYGKKQKTDNSNEYMMCVLRNDEILDYLSKKYDFKYVILDDDDITLEKFIIELIEKKITKPIFCDLCTFSYSSATKEIRILSEFPIKHNGISDEKCTHRSCDTRKIKKKFDDINELFYHEASNKLYEKYDPEEFVCGPTYLSDDEFVLITKIYDLHIYKIRKRTYY